MWIDQQLGGGVVLTRKNTALRPDELLSAEFVKMLPGNTVELYPDNGYDTYRLNLKQGWDIIDMHFMTFDGGFEYVVLVQDDSTVAGGARKASVFDLSTFTAVGDIYDPVMTLGITSGVRSTTLVNRGAEYYFNVASAIGTGAAEVQIGTQLIFYHTGSTLQTRQVGMAPTALAVSASRSTPQPSSSLWSMTEGKSSDSPGRLYDGGSDNDFYSLVALLYDHLYGTYEDMRAEWPKDAVKDQDWGAGLNALLPQGIGAPTIDTVDDWDDAKVFRYLRNHWVPVTKLELRLTGQGFVFIYWVTEYNTTYAVESEPSDITEITSGEGLTAEWRVTVDWDRFFAEGHSSAFFNEIYQDNPDRYGLPTGSAQSSDQVRFLHAKDVLDRVRNAWQAGRTRSQETGTFPLSEAQKNTLVTTLDITGSLNSPLSDPVYLRKGNTTDQIRLYRQNVGVYNDYFLEWNLGELDATQAEPVGEGPRNADDVRDGRINRQGGLLTTIEATDYTDNENSASYEDDYTRSGVGDPGLAYPNINYVTRGGLGVFPYLRQPNPSVAMCNMAQSLLRVEFWTPDGVGQNLILVSPIEDPEQSPLIYSIPIVTERQDTITDLRPLGDTALVFTTTSLLQINYIPFEGYNQQDRVVTQITGNHGAVDNRRGVSVETPLGQIFVWLSATSLMATNGRGAWDICPDFSVQAAEDLGYDFTSAYLINNAAEHRLELWAGGTRFDFLYHRSQMKDIRGDGAGLSFKLMGPTTWYSGITVGGAASGLVGNKFKTFHATQQSDSTGFELHISNTSPVEGRRSSVTTRKIWAKDPTGRLKTKAVGVEYGDALEYLQVLTLHQAVNPDVASATIGNSVIPVNRDRGFSMLTVEDGLGGGGQYQIKWAGDSVGPLWIQAEGAIGGLGS